MATLVLAAAGSAIGSAVGGTFLGISAQILGGIVGSAIGGSLDRSLFGIGNRQTEGPRLGDLGVQASTYGLPVPLTYGTTRLAGNIIWSSGLTETRNSSTESAGGKGGGGSVTHMTYSYAASFAVGLSARPIAGIGRVWADGKLLRNMDGALAVGGEMRIYLGDEAQQPDPLIEAHEGAGNAPAHRGLAYAVFEGLQLASFGNRIPNLTFEIISDDGGSALLGDVVSDLAARADLEAVDSSGLTDTVSGMLVGQVAPARNAIEALTTGYDFDVAEVDGQLRFLAHPRAAIASIGADDLGVGQPVTKMTRGRRQELELPREICLRHIDPERDYQVGTQRARRATRDTALTSVIDLPAVMAASQAKQAAERRLSRTWLGRDRFEFSLLPKYLDLTPGDVVTVSESNRLYTLQLEDSTLAEGLHCRGTEERASAYVSGAVGDGGGFVPQSVAEAGDTTLVLMNLPSVTASDASTPTLYAAAAGASAGWRGAVLFQSTDGELSYQQISGFPVAATMGVATNVLGDGPSAVWDEGGSVNIELLRNDMALESLDDLSVLNGGNAALLGGELLQFRQVVLESDGSYTLSGLLRGRRGTEGAQSTHMAGEAFVLLRTADLRAIEMSLGAIGKSYLYKPATSNATLADAASQAFAYSGLNLKPLSPVHASGARAGDGSLTLTWIRRGRIGGEWADGVDVPLGEDSEAYEVDVMDGAAVVRTISATSAHATYSAAEQTADFGAVQSTVELKIYQISAMVGRGQPLTVQF